jgi:hypothetical protein
VLLESSEALKNSVDTRNREQVGCEKNWCIPERLVIGRKILTKKGVAMNKRSGTQEMD